MSSNILSAAKYDAVMRVRVADVNDLMAAEGCYHPNCLKKFQRETAKAKVENDSVDLAMVWIGQELRNCAEKGHVLELEQVWIRYQTLANDAAIEIPRSFTSRIATFKEKLSFSVNDIYEFIVLNDQAPADRQTILVPTKFCHIPFSHWVDSDHDSEEDLSTIPVFKCKEDDEFLAMVHVALRLRSDIQSQPSFSGVDITEQAAVDCVPSSVYMFLRLLLGGQSLLEEDSDEHDNDEQETRKQSRVVSIAQDLVYSVSGGKKLTPKHIGLGSTLHQATRSKQMVELFHSAGHIASYRDILRIDTALAESTLKHMDHDTGTVVPPNLIPKRFVHFSADNIDINDSTLDGKNTFHATQIAAWQRGPAPDDLLKNIEPSQRSTLSVPEAMEAILPVNILEGTAEPPPSEVKAEWFNKPDEKAMCAQKAEAKDTAFMIIRHDQQKKPTWTSFNQTHSSVDPPKTTIGYMPIIQAPAHEIATLNTVVQRVIQVAAALEQKHAVLTVDQALFPGLMELKWTRPQYRDVLIPRLGGLHTSMNFLKILGQHTQDSGLADVWTESGILGPNSTDKAMSGKSYSKGVRAHKLTLQALWQLLLPQVMSYIDEQDGDLKDDIVNAAKSDEPHGCDVLVTILTSADFCNHMDSFLRDKADDLNFQYWWQYMNMVCILLRFIRAQRDGLWDLHLSAFRDMLPFFHRYDHTNYARWGSVYLSEMNQLPEAVKNEFEKGNFVVKGSDQRFNQVDPDHSQEWLNGTGKKGGGIVGITKTTSALSRWALSYNLRALIATKTRALFMVGHDDQMIHNEATPARTTRDNEDESKIVTVLQRFNVFAPDMPLNSLQNIATKDLATDDIQESLLNAEKFGQERLDTFVKERLIISNDDTTKCKLRDPLHKSKALTFSSLYVTEKEGKGNTSTMKVDRNILQRLITAYQAGRKVDLDEILQHELMPVPVAIASTNGSLRTGNKSVLADVMTKNVTCPPDIEIDQPSCIVIDGQALVVALGKPAGVTNFGELADVFLELVIKTGRPFNRIDVTFDQYRETSIKAGTRKKRTKHARPIRRVVEDGSVPVPANWTDFLAVPDNKADLACFLSKHLIDHAPADKTVVVAGGFRTADEVQSSNPDLDIQELVANHEEADTRLVLHCMHSDAECIVVLARDTDVLVLLVAHFHKMKCQKMWMKAGTAKRRKYIPVHEIRQQLTEPVVDALIPFHAMTGCDTVSYFAGHSKAMAWKVLNTDSDLLKDLGKGELTDQKMKDAEKFVCKLYGTPEANSCDTVRVKLFCKCKSPEALPPTTDALQFHTQRAHYQSMVWIQATTPQPDLPSPTTMGWKIQDGQLTPKLVSRAPIPESCRDIVSCGCTKGCRSNRCTCKKGKLTCTGACKCVDSNFLCMNRQE
ncbi:MAG: hypothetical protein ABW185_04375 [Sedimenticola sp.]